MRSTSVKLTLIGVSNLVQAVLLKLQYEPSDLLEAPQVGMGIQVGQKIPSMQDIAMAINSAVLADPRVGRIENLAIQQDNNAVYLSFVIYPQQVDVPIPIKVKL